MDGSGTTDRVDRAALSPGVSTAGATHTREADPLTVTKRLQRDGRWPDIEPLRDQMMRECRQKGMSKAEAQAWTYSELDRLYPPPMEKPGEQNATSQDEWVQASRLDVVEELPSGATRVHLARADSPAPSKAALGWLETSIRSYAKYVDVAAKATATQQDEQEHVRRERLALEEIDQLLAEMDADICPHCGGEI
jgi:hypothetical protein